MLTKYKVLSVLLSISPLVLYAGDRGGGPDLNPHPIPELFQRGEWAVSPCEGSSVHITQSYLPFLYPSTGKSFNYAQGHLVIPNHGDASAVLIGPQHLLTCGHNLAAANGNLVSDIYFYPGQQRFGRQRVIKHFKTTPAQPGEEPIVLLILDQPIGEKVGYNGMMCANDQFLLGKNIKVTGYPGKANGEQKTVETLLVSVSNNAIDYEQSFSKGYSGGAVSVEYAHSPYVIGIHTRHDDDGGRGLRLSRAQFDFLVLKISETAKLLRPAVPELRESTQCFYEEYRLYCFRTWSLPLIEADSQKKGLHHFVGTLQWLVEAQNAKTLKKLKLNVEDLESKKRIAFKRLARSMHGQSGEMQAVVQARTPASLRDLGLNSTNTWTESECEAVLTELEGRSRADWGNVSSQCHWKEKIYRSLVARSLTKLQDRLHAGENITDEIDRWNGQIDDVYYLRTGKKLNASSSVHGQNTQ